MAPPSSRFARDPRKSKSEFEFLSADSREYLTGWLLGCRAILFDRTALVKQFGSRLSGRSREWAAFLSLVYSEQM